MRLPEEKLITFATKMLERLEQAVRISGSQDLEFLDFDTVATHAERIAGLCRDTFLQ